MIRSILNAMREPGGDWLTVRREIFRTARRATALRSRGTARRGRKPSVAWPSRSRCRARGRVLDRQAGEVPELHQLGLGRLLSGEPSQGLVEGQQVVGGGPATISTSSRSRRRRPPPCFSDCLRRALSIRMRRMASAAAAKKWPRPSQSRSPPGRPAQVGLVDQRRGLERLPRLLPGQPLGGQLAEFLVDQRQQFLRGAGDRLVRSRLERE